MTRIATFDVSDLRDHGNTSDFRQLMNADPRAAFAHFVSLYGSRAVDRPVTDNDALCGAADVLSKDVMSVCSADMDGRVIWEGNVGNIPDGICEDLWEVIMSSEFPAVLVNIVSDPAFYKEEDVSFPSALRDR